MSRNKDSPSWIVYKSYFLKLSKGLSPRHLYDGYNGDNFTVTGQGPFSESSLGKHNYDSDVADVMPKSSSQKFPKDSVKLVTPVQANLDKAKSQLRQQQQEQLEEENKTSMLPPEGVIFNPDVNPHIGIASESPAAQTSVPPLSKGLSLDKKRRNKLSLSEMREKLLQSPGWKRPKMS